MEATIEIFLVFGIVTVAIVDLFNARQVFEHVCEMRLEVGDQLISRDCFVAIEKHSKLNAKGDVKV